MKGDKARRTNITMPNSLWKIAKKRAFDLHFGGNVSAYLAHLVRQDAAEAEANINPAKNKIAAAS